jgi:hypothetical protein
MVASVSVGLGNNLWPENRLAQGKGALIQQYHLAEQLKQSGFADGGPLVLDPQFDISSSDKQALSRKFSTNRSNPAPYKIYSNNNVTVAIGANGKMHILALNHGFSTENLARYNWRYVSSDTPNSQILFGDYTVGQWRDLMKMIEQERIHQNDPYARGGSRPLRPYKEAIARFERAFLDAVNQS